MVNIYVPVLLTLLLYLLFIRDSKLKKYNLSECHVEVFLYSFGLSTSILLSLSLILYALNGKVILGLSEEMLHLGIFIGGVTLLISTLKGINSKLKKNHSKNND
ncbi:hypothetical protein [Methanolobus sp.]|uniref:hypothetical protein n=1 Tax=Methanolobus sp. TaxID=1874737 RepID=UPI0025D09AD0|nr:hypothetical protein [Methanolobus sp.]